ncbi:SURP and G-patch domain-containing protein 2 isoform X2 [Erinaceus europaeus]|uniref:SURP and G-patch domain-containing protein 2 isoform X2 n=2 Tax=Erinaceus europaeus TaxID=9365 RepID=A0ABM3WP01_ERIEU|nr:SURP and G-patch domain-containing protein 2 isoform X2 [Erinaceus europaeus]
MRTGVEGCARGARRRGGRCSFACPRPARPELRLREGAAAGAGQRRLQEASGACTVTRPPVPAWCLSPCVGISLGATPSGRIPRALPARQAAWLSTLLPARLESTVLPARLRLPPPPVPAGLRPQPQRQPGRPALALPSPPAGPGSSLDRMSLGLDGPDVFSRFGVEIIKWAGFHTAGDDARFAQLFGALFELETETCAKTLAAFKCALRPEHRDFCFCAVQLLRHAALRTPRVDGELLDLLLASGAVRTKHGFFQVIKPFDKCVMRLQERLLKGVTPLLMACNAHELSVKARALGGARDLALALDTTNSLCRQSLALLGQTFSLASSFRQEKILEAVGLRDGAPSPAAFPNFEDSALFGREYLAHLKAWLLRSGRPLRVRGSGAQTPPEVPYAAGGDCAAPRRADPRAADTIDQLVSRVVAGRLSPRDWARLPQDPAYWFLLERGSLEFRYYALRLAEERRRCRDLPPEDRERAAATCAVRAMLYARAVRALKRRLLPTPRRGLLRTRTLGPRKAGTRTQTHPAPGVRRKRPRLARSRDAQACPDPRPQPTSPCPAPEVAASMTADRPAGSVAPAGLRAEQLSSRDGTDKPDLWFPHDRSSPAAVSEKLLGLCPSGAFALAPGGESEEEEEEEEGQEGPAAGGSEEGAPAAAQATSGGRYPRKRVSSKSLRVGLIPAPKRLCLVQEPEVHEPVRIAYDRPRGRPASRKAPKDLEFAQQKLTDQNLGFQMLQKMGWKEGLGLGALGAGIREPVSVGAPSEGAGLGAQGPEQDDDTFDEFRQRMIRVYRHKRAGK